MKARRQALYFLRRLPRPMRQFRSDPHRTEASWREVRNRAKRKLLRLKQAEKTRDNREIASGDVADGLPAVRLRQVRCRLGRPLEIGFTQQAQLWEGQEIPAGTRVHVRRAERGLRWKLHRRTDGKFALDIYPGPAQPEALPEVDCTSAAYYWPSADAELEDAFYWPSADAETAKP